MQFYKKKSTYSSKGVSNNASVVNFAMIVEYFWLVNSSKMGVVFLRKGIGIPSESFFAKMERVLASLRVQSYNAKKRIPNFVQICGVSKCKNRFTLPVFIGEK